MPEDSVVWVVLLVVGVFFLAPVLMMMVMMPMMGMFGTMFDAGGPGMMLFMWLLPLLVVALVGYLVYRSIRSHKASQDPAIEELREAYARGDLTDEEFETRQARLRRER